MLDELPKHDISDKKHPYTYAHDLSNLYEHGEMINYSGFGRIHEASAARKRYIQHMERDEHRRQEDARDA